MRVVVLAVALFAAHARLAAAADTTAPSVPIGLVQTDATLASFDLAWDPATDDVGVTEYRVYQFFKGRFPSLNRWVLLIDHVPGPIATVTLAGPGSGSYAVAARDAAGNESGKSAILSARTHQLPGCVGVTGTFAVVGEPFARPVLTATGIPTPTLTLDAGPLGLTMDAAGQATWTPAAGQETAIYPAVTPGVTVTATATSIEGSASCSFTFPVWPLGTDYVFPSMISTLHWTGIGPDTIALAWDPATDNVGVVAYHVRAYHQCSFRSPPGCSHAVNVDIPGDLVAYELTGLRPSTSYTVSIWAIDAAGNFNSYDPWAFTVATLAAGSVTSTTAPVTTTTSTTLVNDIDGDGTPDDADDCPLDRNPGQEDLDGDGLGNPCDPLDAPLEATRATLRAGTPGAAVGRVTVDGRFTTAPPADVFDASADLTVLVTSGDGTNVVAVWTPDLCQTGGSGQVRCAYPDRSAVVSFRPTKGGGWRMSVKLGKQDLLAPLAAPVMVQLVHGLTLVDRVAILSDCSGNRTKLVCAGP